MITTRRVLTAALLTATLAIASPAAAFETSEVATIPAAAAQLKAPLFAPTFTIGLPQQGKVTVTTDSSFGGASVQAAWKKGARTFSTLQNPDFIPGALDSEPDIRYGEVGKNFAITVRSGERFTVGIDALCGSGEPGADGSVASFTCTRKDVKRYGGSLLMTLVTKQANAATIMITSSKGISYAQLVRIARSMTKVQP